ncbi:universal stress protein [Streptomyces sp. NPDC090106]|uniref:universal stress protein n=1 Tax=Streptomyces sp. NPDC090106 TaxID=3365946 RepID=UPI0037F23BE6
MNRSPSVPRQRLDRVIVASLDGPARYQPTVHWAWEEATRRRLPLRVVHHAGSGALADAQLLVTGLRDTDPALLPGCPVVLVPEATAPSPDAEIVLGVDARRPCPAAVDFAFEAAGSWGVRLRAVHAWQLPAARAELPFAVPEEDRATWEDEEVQTLRDALRPWRGDHPEVRVLEDVRLLAPARALVQRSARAGLVVVGRDGGRSPGTTVRALLRDARCPVAVIPA